MLGGDVETSLHLCHQSLPGQVSASPRLPGGNDSGVKAKSLGARPESGPAVVACCSWPRETAGETAPRGSSGVWPCEGDTSTDPKHLCNKVLNHKGILSQKRDESMVRKLARWRYGKGWQPRGHAHRGDRGWLCGPRGHGRAGGAEGPSWVSAHGYFPPANENSTLS